MQMLTNSFLIVNLKIGVIALCLVLAVFLFSDLCGATRAESDQFAYLVELFYSHDNYWESLAGEIASFRHNYPNSEYSQFVNFIQACTELKIGKHEQANNTFENLISQSLNPDLINEVYLNYAVNSFYLKDYGKSHSLLIKLSLLTNDNYYQLQSHLWRGRNYTEQGYLLSAEREYKLCIEQGAEEATEEYFKVLLSLGKNQEAKLILGSNYDNQELYGQLLEIYLSWLLSTENYHEFDVVISSESSSKYRTHPGISLLCARKYLEMGNFTEVQRILGVIPETQPLQTYYRALLYAKDGSIAKSDSLFRTLLSVQELNLSYYAYLELLKNQYQSNPQSATLQLEKFVAGLNQDYIEAQLLLGKFYLEQDLYKKTIEHIQSLSGMLVRFNEQAADILGLAYFRNGDYNLSMEVYNDYLDHYPTGMYRNKAHYYMGIVAFKSRDYSEAQSHFAQITNADSSYYNTRTFYLGEIHFAKSEWYEAECFYKELLSTQPNSFQVFKRLAHVLYYQDRFQEAEEYLQRLTAEQDDFETQILRNAIAFSRKDYSTALKGFQLAEKLASDIHQRTEARANQAFTLYYLSRFDEASSLFYDLSQDSLNAEIYLYQAGKAAAQGMVWKKALDIYDRYLDMFPDSPLRNSVLADIATTLFNMGRYEESLNDWMNLLRRYSANTFLIEQEQSEISLILTGIESCSRMINDPMVTIQLTDFLTLFKSEYIQFELELIIVKLYADADLWDEVLQEAIQMRSSLNIPQAKRNDLEMLLIRSMLNLDQMSQADSLLGEIIQENSNREALMLWAEIALKNGNHSIALDRYLSAYEISPDVSLWLTMLDISSQNGYIRFEEIWSAGPDDLSRLSTAKLYMIEYWFASGSLGMIEPVAADILREDPAPWMRSQAELALGRLQLLTDRSQEALNTFRKIRLLYKELDEIYSQATYYYIITLIEQDALQEAFLTYELEASLLSDEQKSVLSASLQPNE